MTLRSVLTTRQLASVLGRDYRKRLSYIAYGMPIGLRYRIFTIPKKSGGERTICAPCPALLTLQRDILHLLKPDYSPRHQVHGFVSEARRGIVSNAEAHVGKRWVLNIDLENFFETIHFGRIAGRLQAPPYNYTKQVAEFIAHVSCFRKSITVGDNEVPTSVLMPGSALSPILSNMVCDKLDAELARFCRQLGCTYTRYADDITISSDRRTFPGQIGNFDPRFENMRFFLSEGLQDLIESNGFFVNHSKTRVLKRTVRQEVTGITVNERTNVQRKFVRNIRAMLYDWESRGYAQASDRHFSEKRAGRGRVRDARNFEWVVRGKIEFVRNVKGSTDQVFRSLAAKYNRLCSGGKFDIPLVETDEILREAVWYLENDNDGGAVGTCFAIGENLFATCDHCIGDQLRVFSPHNPQFEMFAHVIGRDEHNDLALLSVTSPIAAFMPRACLRVASRSGDEPYGIRTPVQVAGFPSNLDRHSLTIRSSEVSGYSRQTYDGLPASKDNSVELTAGSYQGMSGGPVLCDGEVIGVIIRGPGPEDLTRTPLAVLSEHLNALINRSGREI
ncbi:reverse transcriptase domain-containing protein [Ponticaulis sp.]|uniref:reverse transcriptase domain-containing protein n=1 Tax=Ponticaulis sp. TaxID=2020902 RepID=UPI002619C4FF|nr:reverse transcriptase domain-containing protein [Ponticaulis sp.]MDF1680373.1 reverse transcriptase domain-containing protein [Ponticaulis sp.]